MSYPYSKQKLMTMVLSAAVLASVPSAGAALAAGQPQAAQTVQAGQTADAVGIEINGKPLVLPDANPYIDRSHNRTMVPVRFVSEALAAQVDWKPETSQVTVTKGERNIVLTVGSTKVEGAGKEILLDAPPVIQRGRTYVPLRFVSEALGATVTWRANDRVVEIRTADGQAPAAPAEPAPSKDQEQQKEQLTMAQAVDMALKTNSDLLSLRLDADNADINARLVNSQVKDIPSSLIESLDMAQQKYVTQAKAEMAKKVNAAFVKATESKIKLGVEKAYYDLLNAQADLALKQQSLSRAEQQLKIANVAFQVGTRAKTDVLQAEAGVAAAKAALAVAETNVKVAEMKLNDMLGTDLMKKWELKPEKLAAEQLNMTAEEAASLAARQRAEVLQKQEELKVAELNVDLIDKYLALSTYQGDMARNEVEKAKLALEDTKRSVSLEAAQAYYNLQAAKEALASYQKALDAAKENYRLSLLRYQNGMATTVEVMQADEELSNRENQHQSAVYQYNLALVNFDNAIGN
ncbi:TolC family protein [Brevibacillus sp. SYP-B805]|uniref:stalk domain-containing protein n=1 Tax=Brevibacillus sp. SYP-B805 TaxID=1578199 RepID=UPI0013EA2DEF|nr:stalk domain-containing protein [Brevibacillus sp. SYP-B805]NGQ95997.1 TolC family protein [Brevibacillus sp. SYP-B805]